MNIFLIYVIGLWIIRKLHILMRIKSILLASKFKKRMFKKLYIKYGDIQTKEHSKFKYLRCLLHETMSGETMALNVGYKINNMPKFLYQKFLFLTPALRRLL